MRTRHFLIAACGAALFAAAQAASAGPSDMPVSQFVVTCQSPDDTCKSIVHDVLTERDPLGLSCGSGSPDEDSTKSVVEWLSQHPEWSTRSAAAGVTAAANALWPC